MDKVTALLEKFGLLTRKTEKPDVFDMRLTRIETRERRGQGRRVQIFRSRPSHPAGAVPS